MNEMFAQGDLLIERVADVEPSGTVMAPDATGVCVLAEGELTGHRHAIYDRVTMFRDGSLAREEIIDLVRLGVHWDELGHRLAVLGDDDRLVLGLHLVHDRETVCLEGTRCHPLHTQPHIRL